jgi:HEAT repeat protein
MTLEALSTTELLRKAAELATPRQDLDDRRLWAIIDALHARATREVFEAAAAWCGSPSPILRQLGAAVLCDLGFEQDTPFARESDAVLLPLLTDADDNVVVGAVRALGALGVEDTAALCRVATHRATDVRAALAESLCILEGPDVVSTLIELTRDPDAAVRRNATSGLGGIEHDDMEALRLALVERLRDADADTREEAIFVLAQLGDERVGPALREARTEPETSELIEMAAMAFEHRKQPGRAIARWPEKPS